MNNLGIEKNLNYNRLQNSRYEISRRLLNIICGVVAIILTSSILVIITLAIKI